MLGRLVKLALLFAVVALLGLALFRPAALFGFDATALANSLGSDLEHARANCVGDGSDRWRCTIEGGRLEGVEYVLNTHQFGCWSAAAVSRPNFVSSKESLSGCIGLADEFGH